MENRLQIATINTLLLLMAHANTHAFSFGSLWQHTQSMIFNHQKAVGYTALAAATLISGYCLYRFIIKPWWHNRQQPKQNPQPSNGPQQHGNALNDIKKADLQQVQPEREQAEQAQRQAQEQAKQAERASALANYLKTMINNLYEQEHNKLLSLLKTRVYEAYNKGYHTIG